MVGISLLAGTISSSDELVELGTSWWLLSDIFRSMFYFLDSILYYIIPELYNLALKLADIRTALNQQAVVDSVTTGLYTFFALAMFFRYAFAILTMIADPDKIEDKQKGLSKIVMNSIIAVVLTVAVPTIFNIAYDAQRILIGDGKDPGIIYNAFTRVGSGNNSNIVAADSGTRISKQVFDLFVEPVLSTYTGPTKGDIETQWELYKSSGVFRGVLLSQYIDDDNNYKYAIAYLGPLSTVVGIFMAWTLLVTVIEVALRSIKLFALQVVSPIAIITYVDPDSATKGIFKRWVDECMKTYLSLFFRIFVLSFFITIMSNIDISKIVTMGFWVVLFFILGLMSFIKIAPKMFEDIFGYKAGDKTWGTDIVKKGLGFGGHVAAGTVGAGLGMGLGAVTGGISSKIHGLGFKAGMKTGAGAGLKAGAKAGYTAKKLGGYAKIPFAGMAGRKASEKEFGYKSSLPFTEGAGEKAKYNTEIGLAAREFEKYKTLYEKGAGAQTVDKDTGEKVSAARNYARETMKSMRKQGLSDFKQEDVEALRKAYAKGTAYKGMFSKDYGEALQEYAAAKAKKQVFERNLRRVQQEYSAASNLEERKALKAQFDMLVSAEGSYNKTFSNAEDRIKEYDKNPLYSLDSALYQRLERADKLPKGPGNLIASDVSIDSKGDWDKDIAYINSIPSPISISPISSTPPTPPTGGGGFFDGGGI